jgi:hypothetical protein
MDWCLIMQRRDRAFVGHVVRDNALWLEICKQSWQSFYFTYSSSRARHGQTILLDVVDFVCECYRLRLPDSHYHSHSLHAAAATPTCTSSIVSLLASIFGKVETLYRWCCCSVHFSARLACNFRVGRRRGKELIDCFGKLHTLHPPSALKMSKNSQLKCFFYAGIYDHLSFDGCESHIKYI